MDNNADGLNEELVGACFNLVGPYVAQVNHKFGQASNFRTQKEENDFEVTMRRIQIIEQAIKAGQATKMFKELHKRQTPNELSHPSKRENHFESWELLLSTVIAREKVKLYEIGLLELEEKGDFRTARLIGKDKRFNILQFKKAREDPSVMQSVAQEAITLDPVTLKQLLSGAELQVVDFKHVISRLRWILLNFWIIPSTTRDGREAPPLCYFSDPALAKYVGILLCRRAETSLITSGSINQRWNRMGLVKARKKTVRKFEQKGAKTRFFVEGGMEFVV